MVRHCKVSIWSIRKYNRSVEFWDWDPLKQHGYITKIEIFSGGPKGAYLDGGMCNGIGETYLGVKSSDDRGIESLTDPVKECTLSLYQICYNECEVDGKTDCSDNQTR